MSATVCFVTPTHGPDLWRFALLRRSIRIFAPGIRHYALLDMEDLPMFRERFRDDPGVEFVVSRNLLPRSIEERRVRARSWQGALLRRIAWRTKMLPDPLNGWRLQQFMKLYFLRQAPTPNVVFMDSDIVLCAPVDEDYFFEDGALRLLELPAHNVEDHAFDVCTHLLMQTPVQEARAFYNYILQVPRFRRATGEVLMAALERQSAKSDWHDRFMQLPFPSEYNLLGYAARHLQGYAGYFREPVPARGWTYDIRFRGDEKNLDKVLQTCIDERGARRVLLVQSTLGMPESEYTAHIHAMLARLQAFHADAPAPEVA